MSASPNLDRKHLTRVKNGEQPSKEEHRLYASYMGGNTIVSIRITLDK